MQWVTGTMGATRSGWLGAWAPPGAVLALLALVVLRTAGAGTCQVSMVRGAMVTACPAQGHHMVPSINSATRVLLMPFNRLMELTVASFPSLGRLQKLYLGQQLGGTLRVGPGAFANLPNLTHLDLGGNKVLSLDPAALAGLDQLEVLLLDANGLDEAVLEGGFFRDLVSLRHLDLSGNRIRRLHLGPSFQALRALETLNLRLNSITAVCSGDLAALAGRHLTLLDLSNNQLWGAEARACGSPFLNLTVDTLDVSSNPWDVARLGRFLQTLEGARLGRLRLRRSGAVGSNFGFRNLRDPSAETFVGLRGKGLQALDMSGCFVAELGPRIFSPLPELQELNLSGNRLHLIHANAFAGLQSLRVLDLSGNLLGELGVEGLRSLWASPLESLDLSRNHVGAVEPGALKGFTMLRVLDLRDNALRRVPPGPLPALRCLLLGHNRLVSAWGLRGLTRGLGELDLSSNRLRDLAGLWQELGEATGLQALNLSGNGLSGCREAAPPALAGLQVLDLSRNALGQGWGAGGCLAGLEGLRVLNLSRNGLWLLPEGGFPGLRVLRELDLSGNPLATLPGGVFGELGLLEVLDLQGVPLLCHCSLRGLAAWLGAANVTLAEGTSCLGLEPPFPEQPLLPFVQSACPP